MPKRCEKEDCKCKLTLTSFPCKCQKYFCQKHQHSEEHQCSYDYRAEQKKELNKYMSSPVISAKIGII